MAYASGQAQWLRELTGQDWVQAIRADGQRNVLAIAETVAAWADWSTLESRPTWEVLMRASGLSARTVARWLLELRLRGWLELLEHGSTPSTRPMTLADLEGNRAAVYGLRLPLTPERAAAAAAELMLNELATELDQLTAARVAATESSRTSVPGEGADQLELGPVDISGTPSWSFRSLEERSKSGCPRARKPVDNSRTNPPDQGKQRMTALRAGPEDQGVPGLLIMVPVSGFEMLACADELRRRRPAVFGRCSRRLVRALCRDFWRAGWCNRDVLHALEHRPAMFDQLPRELGMPAELVSPRQLIRGRLRAWRDDRGRVRPGYWSSRAPGLAGQGAAVVGMSARELVRQRHGRAGVRLLRAGERHLSVERIREYARAAPANSGVTAAEAGPAPGAVPEARAEAARRRVERDRRHAQRAEHARAELARLGRLGDPAPPPADAAAAGATSGSGSGTTSAYERALARARVDGRAPRPRRRRGK